MDEYSDSIEQRLTGRHKKCVIFCQDMTGKVILNLGCYNGWFEKAALQLGCKSIIGSDINEGFLKISKKHVPQALFIKTSLFGLPFADNFFDLVTLFDVLEHVPGGSETRVFGEIRRVLRKNGNLVISTPQANFLSNFFDPVWYLGHRHYKVKKLCRLLEKEKFEVKNIEQKGRFAELCGLLFLYIFKWLFRRESCFKAWFDKKRDKEYLLSKPGFMTLFLSAGVNK